MKPSELHPPTPSVEQIVRTTLGDPGALLARPVDLDALQREAQALHRNPFGNLARLIDSALHRRTEDYLIVTDVEADASKLRAFLRRHWLAYRALRARLMRDDYARAELERRATGCLGRVTSIDLFRYIARKSGGATAVSLHGRAAVFLLPGFHAAETARASLEASSLGRLVVSRLSGFSDPDLLSFVIRLHTRHEAAHSEDGLQHLAGVRNRYVAEPESDAAMTLFAKREATLLGHDVRPILESVAALRELAGESYFFCSRAIHQALQVDVELLLRMQHAEIARLADAIADSVVPAYEVLTKIERSIAEMWTLTRSSAIRHDATDPRHARMAELLGDPDTRVWLSQTLAAFERFELCLEEHRERVLHYAKQFYAGQPTRDA